MIIDFHAHILPGMDHGCDSVDMALRQLARAARAGVDTVAATSHFYPQAENAAGFLRRRDEAMRRLQSRLTPTLPRIIPGAEILLFERLEQMEDLNELSLGPAGCLLLELPLSGWRDALYDTAEAINHRCGGKAVLAHVERYRPERIERLFELGLHGQLNAAALSRLTGRRRLYQWIDAGHIVALGSDTHGLDHGYRAFRKAQTRLRQRFDQIMERSAALLTG